MSRYSNFSSEPTLWASLPLDLLLGGLSTRVLATRRKLDRSSSGRTLTVLGLPEHGGVIGWPGAWRVVARAGAWWWPPDASSASAYRDGARIDA